MALIFRHGKQTRVLVDQYDMSPMMTATAVMASMAPADTTAYQKNDHTYIAGLQDTKISFGGLFSNDSSTSLNRVIDAALGSSVKHIVTVGWDGSSSTGSKAYMFVADDVKKDIHSPVTNVVSLAVDMQASSNTRTGVLLRPLKIATATTANTGVINTGTTAAGGVTGGGVGHLHYTAGTGITSLIAKVQHSTSGSTWADLIVFTTITSTAAKVQRSTVAGTIKERVRANITTLTGTNATVAIAFACQTAVI